MNNLQNIQFIHYGSNDFNINKFYNIKNLFRYKPSGWLWWSPLNSKFWWKEFCIKNNFNTATLDNCFNFKIQETSNIYIIDNLDDIQYLKNNFLLTNEFDLELLDYENLAREYDWLFFSYNANKLVKNRKYIDMFNFYDCESILIFNKHIINVI